MNTHFFKNKMKEVRNFLKIIRGRVKKDPRERLEGTKGALQAVEEEKKEYLREKQEAENKVLREAGGQDISAI